MAAQRKYPIELRERATRMAIDARKNPATRAGGYRRIGEQLGVHPEALRTWVKQAETDQGMRPGRTTDDQARIGELEREVRELRRANTILRQASAFFALMSAWIRRRGWLVSSLLRSRGSFSAMCRPADVDAWGSSVA